MRLVAGIAVLLILMVPFVSATLTDISISSPANNTWTADSTPSFSFIATSDVNQTFSCELIIDSSSSGSNASTGNATLTTITANPALSEGSRVWYISCTDSGGTVNSTQRTLNIDVTAPSSTITSPSNDTVTSDATPEISFNLTDNLDDSINYSIFVDGSANGQGGTAENNTGGTINISALADGLHTIVMQAEDEAGNTANSSALTITIDTAAPTSTINSPNDGTSTNDTTPQINFTLTDNIGATINYTVFLNGTANITGSAANGTDELLNLSSLTEGDHAIIVQATDDADISTNSSSITITIDTIKPNVTSTSPTGTQSTSAGSIAVSLQVVTNEISICRYDGTNTSYANMGSNFSTSNNLTHTASETHSSDGAITWYVRCTDSSGNSMLTSVIISYTIDVNVATSSGGGGGGGGGTLSPLSARGNTFRLNERFGQYTFQHERRTHYVRVKELTDDHVVVTFRSDPVDVTLREGEEKNIDITGDGVVDVYIRLDELAGDSAAFTIAMPKDIQKPAMPEPAPETVQPAQTQALPDDVPTDAVVPETDIAEEEVVSSPETDSNAGTLIVTILVLLIVGGAGWWYFQSK